MMATERDTRNLRTGVVLLAAFLSMFLFCLLYIIVTH